MNIIIATLNINGATAPSHDMNLIRKWITINYMMRNHKTAILTLQETHLDEEYASNINNCFHRSFDLHYSYNCNNMRGSTGVAFLINKALIEPKNIKVQTLVPGHTIILTITRSKTEKTSILNVYVPISRPSQPHFWEKLERRRIQACIPCLDFVLGDFNITEDLIDRAPPRLDN